MSTTGGWDVSPTGVVGGLSHLIDKAGMTMVSDVTPRVAAAVAPWVIVGLLLVFVTAWLMVMRGRMQLDDAFWKLVWAWFVITVALTSGMYLRSIAPWLTTMWDHMASFLIPGSGDAADMVDKAAALGGQNLAKLWSSATGWSMDSFFVKFTAFVLAFVFAVVIGIGTIYVLMAKLGIYVLVALGPAFIVALILPATARFFTLWIGQWINYGLLLVVVSIVFTIVVSITANYIADMRFDGTQSLVMSFIGALIVSGVGGVLLVKVAGIVSALAGGASIGGFLSEARVARGGASSMLGSSGYNQAVPSIGAGGGLQHSIQRAGRSGLLGAGHRAVGLFKR